MRVHLLKLRKVLRILLASFLLFGLTKVSIMANLTNRDVMQSIAHN